MPRPRFTDTALERFTKALGHVYRLVTLMTTSTMHTNNHLSGMSNVNPCAKMSSEISEAIWTFIAISFFKTHCLATVGFVLHPLAFHPLGPHTDDERRDPFQTNENVGSAHGAVCEEKKRCVPNNLAITQRSYQQRFVKSLCMASTALHRSSFFSGIAPLGSSRSVTVTRLTGLDSRLASSSSSGVKTIPRLARIDL